MIKKPKKKPLSKVKGEAWRVFSLFIRTRDCLRTTGSPEYGECITCDFSGHISKLQAGHFVPKHSGNYFSERGVHAQCRTCNLYGKNGQAAGMPLEYRRQIVKLYGEDIALELEDEPRQIKKFTLPELKQLEEKYKQKIKELE